VRERAERAPVRVRESAVEESAPRRRDDNRARGEEPRAERALPLERERRRGDAPQDRMESERAAPVQRGKEKALAPKEQ
jgi:hypothetical protein